MQQELIEMLEKVLNWYDYIGSDSYYAKDTGELVKEAEALIEKAKNNAPAVPQGEPVAWMVTNGDPHSLYFSRMYADDAVWMAKNVCYKKSIPNDFQIHPLYSTPAPAPAQEVGLTDEDIFEVAKPFGAFQYGDAQGDKRLDFARAIIAALHANGK